MQVSKKIVAELEKCYAICPITIRGIKGFLVATEKAGDCRFFDEAGNHVETVWSEPGGVMSLVAIPGGEGAFLATHEFFSPNDSARARIVLARPAEDGWTIKTLTDLPFVHRFDLLQAGEKQYLIACSIKSAHEFREDWNHPGKVWVAELPGDVDAIEALCDSGELGLCDLGLELTQNHGYSRLQEQDRQGGLIGSKNGIYKIFPPKEEGEAWSVTKILNQQTSDCVLMDINGDGKDELITFSMFHGDHLDIFEETEDGYRRVWASPLVMEFLHAIWPATIEGEAMLFFGHRQGKRNLYVLRYSKGKGYYTETLDEDVGPTNCNFIETPQPKLIAANREINQVALYTIESL
ncbi:hypothetical protein ACQRBK_06860 [Peptoniphilaceae bacterium SGI.137]|nr:hypothetical protein [Peptoniphilaceae bacterium]